ncbi:MAG: hypothetical protein A2W72_12515 [Burkholderiales bacterium RIFCSPLOWO2_12_67_14]|nr:MAG: hypothetical protein A3I64_15240 [Burkholderiales bacterium RIFCSPLOWO2_02_FULL_67_64]OGB42445.1 MAG: hypothetical protein A2W72_12515 [Burkholderiales bacterium RIFCSPLOWO2_12_67_14]OGB44324.1 MAG: hypothetical protein A3E51_01305 [Burkholderiales bacterium RIFCSPHIGHO2_12_FULL_67_38]OGB93818.1 MAG: hypothetical protein A3G82_12890 [Burkholderiales bacterium RIFCSPLOWO2_12_FULL_67_210]
MTAAYIIVNMQISNMEQYQQYMAAAPAAVAAAGGEYLVRGGRFEVLEGDWQPTRIAMLRFPSYEQAKAFYDSEMYRLARAKRAGATEFFNLVLVEGVSAPVI